MLAVRGEHPGTGTVDAVQSGAAGTVLVKPSWRGDWVQICSAAAAWKGVAVESCKRWGAAAMLAYVTGSPASLHYDNATAASCAEMATGAGADGASQFINQ